MIFLLLGLLMVCGSLDGKGVWGRMDTYLCMAESFHQLCAVLNFSLVSDFL